MISANIRIIAFVSLYTIGAMVSPAMAQATFRIVSYMGKWGPPGGLVEGVPGIFYSTGGSAQEAAFSITPQGFERSSPVFRLATT